MVTQTTSTNNTQPLSDTAEDLIALASLLTTAELLHALCNTVKIAAQERDVSVMLCELAEKYRLYCLNSLTEKQREALRIRVKLGWIAKEHAHPAVLATLARKGYIDKGQGVYNVSPFAHDLLTPISVGHN